ncbi:hypothetical protein Tco_0682801 [Tanacetum coccineum]|uniref:Uncharacterized protein n=1 Tax=Tanacetum coccineum TaxID=301880 RepID=A0ABQ4XTT0_9ASTR
MVERRRIMEEREECARRDILCIFGALSHFKTLSLDELRSPGFNLFFDQEDYSEEEVAETMAETMEQYMSKTQADYGSGLLGLKIHDLRGAIPTKTVADAKVAIQEMAEYSQKWHNGTSRSRSKTSDELAAIQA